MMLACVVAQAALSARLGIVRHAGQAARGMAQAVKRPPVITPQVGIAGVVVRAPSSSPEDVEFLLIQRAKEPGKGMWSFPGGRLELGETIAQGVTREIKEETGIDVVTGPTLTTVDVIVPRHKKQPIVKAASIASTDSSSQGHEQPSATDSQHEELDFHYVIVDLLCTVKANTSDMPKASSDVSDARWLTVAATEQLGEAVHDLTVPTMRLALQHLVHLPLAQFAELYELQANLQR